MNFRLDSPIVVLVEGCKKQNRLAQKYLYQRLYSTMFGVAMRYSGSREEAQEVLNTAFLKVFNSIIDYKSTGSFEGWVKKIVFHTGIDSIRKYAKVKKNTTTLEDISDPAFYDYNFENMAVEEIYSLIQKLPPATRAVFSMYAIEGYKHKEIAKELNVSEGTSKWHLANARKKLQDMILVEGY